MKTPKTSSTLFTSIIDITRKFSQKNQEIGDGETSDVYGDLIEEIDDIMMDALVDKRIHVEGDEVVASSNQNIVKLSEAESKSLEESRHYIPSISKKCAPTKKKHNEPEFAIVDNPGNWIECIL